MDDNGQNSYFFANNHPNSNALPDLLQQLTNGATTAVDLAGVPNLAGQINHPLMMSTSAAGTFPTTMDQALQSLQQQQFHAALEPQLMPQMIQQPAGSAQAPILEQLQLQQQQQQLNILEQLQQQQQQQQLLEQLGLHQHQIQQQVQQQQQPVIQTQYSSVQPTMNFLDQQVQQLQYHLHQQQDPQFLEQLQLLQQQPQLNFLEPMQQHQLSLQAQMQQQHQRQHEHHEFIQEESEDDGELPQVDHIQLLSEQPLRLKIKFPFRLKFRPQPLSGTYNQQINSFSSMIGLEGSNGSVINDHTEKKETRTSSRSRSTVKKNYKDDIESDESTDEDDEDDEDNKVRHGSSNHAFIEGDLEAPKRRGRPAKKRKFEEDPDSDVPPPGVLPSLWYTREAMLHIYVIEKILAWRTRPIMKFTMEQSIPQLEDGEYQILRDYVIDEATKHGDWQRRMEISRIYPNLCYICKSAMSPSPPIPTINREEVVLIKWRGFSHIHCSWERTSDLVKFDNQSKNKLKRYFMHQENTYGPHWRALLDEESNSGGLKKNDSKGEEFYFSQDYREVERIYFSDENEMDLNVLYRQRAANREAEIVQSRNRQYRYPVTYPVWREEEDERRKKLEPEDTVRYVVKWRGMPTAEMTWEYYKDIKYDFLNEVEDFWLRQRSAPNDFELATIWNKPHPQLKDFRKLYASPIFGIPSTKRPLIINRGGTEEMYFEENIRNSVDNDDDAKGALRLRSYQLEGVNWLLWNWYNRRSCILADEMGLGKTIQSVCFLQQLYISPQTNIRGPFLIVAPLTLIGQWQSETVAWAPDLNIVVYHGSQTAREYLRKVEWFYSEPFVSRAEATRLRAQNITKFHIMITTYEVVLKDIAMVSKIRWKALIVDEAHRLKNQKAKLFEELVSVPREFCLLLTGTPLQNSTEELWALLHFSDQFAFGSKELFIEKFGQLTDASQVRDLHAILKPYLLRRVKEDVEKSLPPKEETILEVSLTPIQKTYYKAIYEKNTSFLFRGKKPSNAPSLMNIMMELRKCCNHPFLIRGAEERIMNDAAAREKYESGEGDDYKVNMLHLSAEQLVKSSGKLVLLDKLLPKLKEGGHKVLIFSQMVRVLDLLENLFRIKRYLFERLDGSTSAALRVAAVDRFHRKSCNRFIMLLSTRAGGLGLNLTAADTVIIFDSDWNPQNDLQAMARAHRIGQTRAVRVYRLLTAKTYEMHMFHTASMKLGLDRAVLASQRSDGIDDGSLFPKKVSAKTEREMQAKEIDELLKKGAYDVFRDDDDNEAQQFMETDIDQLLEKRAKNVTYGKTEGLSSGLGSFSKASFVASSSGGDGVDIDLDDPDFWSKAVGLETPVKEKEKNANVEPDGKKRSRRQVQIFDPFASVAEANRKRRAKLAEKLKGEKELKERARLEKKLKKMEEAERKKREREVSLKEARDRFNASPTPSVDEYINDDEVYYEEEEKKSVKDTVKTKQKKQKLLRGNEHILDAIKQTWEVPQRNRIISATLRFGFGRFCKVRQESNLTSLPIQDLEVFVRAYLFQVGIQAGYYLNKSTKQGIVENFKPFLDRLNMSVGYADSRWILDAIQSSLRQIQDIMNYRRSLRVPLLIADSSFVSDLRKGAAMYALRRLAFLTRLNTVVENALDLVLADLGHEELGKRGCPSKDLTSLDIDLKARHVTTEELSHYLGKFLDCLPFWTDSKPPIPAPWWDRGCDLSLLIGTFIHGLGNYDEMQRDEDLPYDKKIKQYASSDIGCAQGFYNYVLAFNSVMIFYEKENFYSKIKSDNIYSALTDDRDVSKKNLNDAVSAEEYSGVDFQKSSVDVVVKLSNTMIRAIHKSSADSFNFDAEASKMKNAYNKYNSHYLPMPDPCILDNLLLLLINNIEKNMKLQKGINFEECHFQTSLNFSCVNSNQEDSSREKNVVLLNRKLYSELSSSFNHNMKLKKIFDGNLCGVNCLYLHDFCNYPLRDVRIRSGEGSYLSSSFLVDMANPDNLSRYGLTALIHAEKMVMDIMLDSLNKKETLFSTLDSSNTFRHNDQNRVIFNFLVLYFGSPLIESRETYTKVHGSVWNSLFGNSESSGMDFTSDEFLSFTKLLEMDNIVNGLDIFSMNGTPIEANFNPDDCEKYLNEVLLPHCLELCLGWFKDHDDSDTWDTYEKEQNLTPLPDPSLPISLHSEEAVLNAAAILRRIRLMAAIRFIVGGGVPSVHLLSFLRGPTMRRNLDGLPIWWCPWIHDLAMLIYVASNGLNSVTSHYKQHKFDKVGNPIFSSDAIKKHVRTLFIDGREGLKPVLPRCYLNTSSKSNLESWLEYQSKLFPCQQVLERRLALICSELTTTAASMNPSQREYSWRYDNMPMFDHGGWPIHDYPGQRTIYGCGVAPNINSSLLYYTEAHAVKDGN